MITVIGLLACFIAPVTMRLEFLVELSLSLVRGLAAARIMYGMYVIYIYTSSRGCVLHNRETHTNGVQNWPLEATTCMHDR